MAHRNRVRRHRPDRRPGPPRPAGDLAPRPLVHRGAPALGPRRDVRGRPEPSTHRQRSTGDGHAAEPGHQPAPPGRRHQHRQSPTASRPGHQVPDHTAADQLKCRTRTAPRTLPTPCVERGGLFTGIRGRQIAGRFCLITTSPFPRTTECEGLVATLEDALRLHRHTPCTLRGLDRYLHQRTGGMIESLSHLIRGAALEAIMDGTAKIPRQLLDTIDHRPGTRRTEQLAFLCASNSDVDLEFWLTFRSTRRTLVVGPHLAPTP